MVKQTDRNLQPSPKMEEKNGRFFARWSFNDEVMRSRRRSVLEMPDRICTVDDAFLAALRTDDGEVRWDNRNDIRDLGERIKSWFLTDDAERGVCSRIRFRLAVPRTDDKNGVWTLSADVNPSVREELLSLGLACRVYPPLRGMTGLEMSMSCGEAGNFLRSGVAALRSRGYEVEVPESLAAEVEAEAELQPEAPSGGAAAKNADAGVKAKVTVRVAGCKVTRAEIEFLLEQGSSLVFFRGKWIEVDRNILKSALKAFELSDASLSRRDAVALAFGFKNPHGIRLSRVKGTGWFGKVLDELRSGGGFKVLPRPKGFKGTLRAYQKRGFSWISYLAECGFGALLADDMGLGKTVQTIAWILHRKARDPQCGKVLIVAPVSVTLNWMRELANFAPELKVMVHHGKERLSGGSLLRAVSGCDVVVIGYPLFLKDHALLVEAGFSAIVLDEAQKIKNPDTRTARAARAFPAEDRLALTGTPFENRVTDLWSIEEFLNQGLLGARSEFVQDFGPMPGGGPSVRAFSELKKILEPFLLRRLKTDPRIAAEIGPKREVREYCTLSSWQRAAYETALARYAYAPKEGRGRNGNALALLTELKLICDGFDSAGNVRGGKVERLEELLETIFESGESALVFTQYVKVGEKLKALLEKKFDRRVPFLHGGLSPAAREECIAGFNSAKEPTAFILSLKAGGFGLNLTKATHVIHYDRWWNPAVENQATDRAHRIGQKHSVLVHLFVCHGTLEDRIDQMLESKREAAGEVVVSGEGFLMKMSEEEFVRTVRLS